MHVETLLPLGKVDPGLREPGTALDIRTVYEDAQLVESLGYDALMVEETKEDPYMVMALAALATFASIVTLIVPFLEGDKLRSRMKSVASERERLKAQNLLAAVRKYSNFPIVLETYRQALSDVFDIAALRDLLRRSVAARSEQCTREQCAGERDCPFGKRRAAMAGAHHSGPEQVSFAMRYAKSRAVRPKRATARASS